MKKAMLWHKENCNVRCDLCARRCIIANGAKGVCLVRKNVEGTLYSLNYGKLISISVDPIEKKPLFHFLPGEKAFSIASAGCNFACVYCNNWEISQIYRNKGATSAKVVGKEYAPKDIVAIALKNKCRAISYTYTEPAIFFEFAHDVSKLARKSTIKNTFVTNGYMTPKAVKKARYLDAATVNLKASGEPEFYKKYTGVPSTEPIFECLKEMKKQKIFIEITDLIIPKYGEDEGAFRKLVKWIVSELGPETPFHILRFYPSYKVDWPETPLATLEKFYKIAKSAGLNYVYLGNVGQKEDTLCPDCGALLIERRGFSVRMNLNANKHNKYTCPECGKGLNLAV